MTPSAEQRLVDQAAGSEQHAQGEGAQHLVHPIGNDERHQAQAHLLGAAGLGHVVGERIAEGEVDERHEDRDDDRVDEGAHMVDVQRHRPMGSNTNERYWAMVRTSSGPPRGDRRQLGMKALLHHVEIGQDDEKQGPEADQQR